MITDSELQERFPFGFLLIAENEALGIEAIKMAPVSGGNDTDWHAITEFDADAYFSRDVEEVDGVLTLTRSGEKYSLRPLDEAKRFKTFMELEDQ